MPAWLLCRCVWSQGIGVDIKHVGSHSGTVPGPPELQMYMWALRGCKCTCGPSGAANVHVGPPELQMYMWALRSCKCTCGPSGAPNAQVGPPGLQMYMWALRGCKCICGPSGAANVHVGLVDSQPVVHSPGGDTLEGLPQPLSPISGSNKPPSSNGSATTHVHASALFLVHGAQVDKRSKSTTHLYPRGGSTPAPTPTGPPTLHMATT